MSAAGRRSSGSLDEPKVALIKDVAQTIRAYHGQGTQRIGGGVIIITLKQ